MKEVRKLLQEIHDNRHEVVCLSRKDRLDLDDHAEISRMNRRHQDLTVTLEAAMREFVAKLDNHRSAATHSRRQDVIDGIYKDVYTLVTER